MKLIQQVDVLLAKVPTPKNGSSANWRRAFGVLAIMTCTGFVTSSDVSRIVDALRAVGEEEAADTLAALFNGTRASWVQGFMG